ncbi:MAG: TetR/AcrR family transcriptional regulator [Frankiaceae bacterium]
MEHPPTSRAAGPEHEQSPRRTESRTAILDAAEQLIATSGYDGTSTAHIAATAGVTRTLIFHYFPSKENLFETLLRERGNADLHNRIRPPAGADLVEALTTLASLVYSETLLVSPRMTQIILREAMGNPIAQRLFTDIIAQLDALVRDTILTVLDPEPAPPQVEAAATTFAAVLLRAILLQRFAGIAFDAPHPAAVLCARALAERSALPEHPAGAEAADDHVTAAPSPRTSGPQAADLGSPKTSSWRD